jgi:hypothetical protein
MSGGYRGKRVSAVETEFFDGKPIWSVEVDAKLSVAFVYEERIAVALAKLLDVMHDLELVIPIETYNDLAARRLERAAELRETILHQLRDVIERVEAQAAVERRGKN